MNDFSPMTNKDIRRRAWALCKRSFPTILAASFLFSLVTALLSLCSGALMNQSIAVGIAGLIAIVILQPAINLGMIHLMGDLWHEQRTGIGVLFAHFGQLGRIWGIQLLMLCYELLAAIPYCLIAFPLVTLGQMGGDLVMGAGLIVIILASVIYFVATVWLALRLSLSTTALVLNENLTARECVRASWAASRGNAKRIFCHLLVLCLPLLAAEILISLLLTNANIIGMLASLLIETLFTGYISLGEFGLFEQLLNAGSSPMPVHPAGEWRDDSAPIILPAPEDEDPNH
ncbi:MAG: hypothetical protein ACI4MF_08735 [Candidatus Faecivicinus sp.]